MRANRLSVFSPGAGEQAGREGAGFVVDLALTARNKSGNALLSPDADRDTAIRRLHEGAQIARALSLRRLAALAENERIRLGLPAHPEFGVLPVVSYDTRRRPVDAIDEITVQHEEASAFRTLLAEQDPAKAVLACRHRT